MFKWFLWIYAFLAMQGAQAAQPESLLTVAVTANFESAFQRLQPLFEKKYAISVTPVFGSTGKLTAQIMHGAPFDVFLAGDQAHIQQLEAAGLADSADRVRYARGELVAYGPRLQLAQTGLTPALCATIDKIAIANPHAAPYGAAAQQVIHHLHLEQALRAKLVTGESVGQVAAFLEARTVDIGFIARAQWLTLLKSRHSMRPEAAWVIPQAYYTPLIHYATLVKTTPVRKNARLFLAFLKTRAAQQVIAAEGYTP